MCGIVGYIGKQEATPILVEGLKTLEYRGYDSSGVAVLNNEITMVKTKGRLVNLENKLEGSTLHGHLGIPNRTTINLRLDEFDRNKNDAARAVHGENVTFTAEYFFHKKARLTFTYQTRDWDTDGRTKGTNPEIIGNGILSDVGNRMGLELTFIFKNVLLR